MSGKKGMKKYPIWIREKIFEEIKEGKSQNQKYEEKSFIIAVNICTDTQICLT